MVPQCNANPLSGKNDPPLPPSRRYRALMASIKMEALTFPSDCQIEPYLVNLLHRMLDKNPKTRITLEGALNHEWVTKEGVCPGGEIDIPGPGRDRRLSEAQRGIPLVAGSRGEDKQHRAAIGRRAGATAGEEPSAGTGARSPTRKNMAARNSIGGPSTQNNAGFPTRRHRQFSLSAEMEISRRGGDKKIVPPPTTIPLPTSMSRSRSYRPSSLAPQAPSGEEQEHQQRRRQPRHEQAVQDGERRGKAERGHHRRFGQEAAVAAAKRKTGMNEEEVEADEEDEEASTWSDGDDKVPSPRILEDIVDNW